jgi:hypothetical protein
VFTDSGSPSSPITDWSQREVLSNERVPGTFVYGNQRVIYDSGSRYAGSAAHQDQAAPDYSPSAHQTIIRFDMPRDELVWARQLQQGPWRG